MNNIYKTVWNAVRGQLVVVNETTTSHSQANSSKSGSEVGLSTRTFAKKLLPCMIAGLLATPLAYAYNPVIIDYDEDTSGAIVTGWGDTTVQAGASLTNNLDAWIPELTVPNASLTINGKLTNLGTVTGDGVIKAQSVDNQSSLTMGTLEILNPMSGQVALTNTGDATIEDLKLGVASATNEGSLTINNAQFALSGKITNKANAQKLALKNVALSGEIANEASSGVTVEGLGITLLRLDLKCQVQPRFFCTPENRAVDSSPKSQFGLEVAKKSGRHASVTTLIDPTDFQLCATTVKTHVGLDSRSGASALSPYFA